MKKFEYEKIIQQYFGRWEDVSSYEANSKGVPVDSKLLKGDLKEYRLMGYPVRVIFRKTRLVEARSLEQRTISEIILGVK